VGNGVLLVPLDTLALLQVERGAGAFITNHVVSVQCYDITLKIISVETEFFHSFLTNF
jgi:hypothetical protein